MEQGRTVVCGFAAHSRVLLTVGHSSQIIAWFDNTSYKRIGGIMFRIQPYSWLPLLKLRSYLLYMIILRKSSCSQYGVTILLERRLQPRSHQTCLLSLVSSARGLSNDQRRRSHRCWCCPSLVCFQNFCLASVECGLKILLAQSVLTHQIPRRDRGACGNRSAHRDSAGNHLGALPWSKGCKR